MKCFYEPTREYQTFLIKDYLLDITQNFIAARRCHQYIRLFDLRPEVRVEEICGHYLGIYFVYSKNVR